MLEICPDILTGTWLFVSGKRQAVEERLRIHPAIMDCCLIDLGYGASFKNFKSLILCSRTLKITQLRGIVTDDYIREKRDMLQV